MTDFPRTLEGDQELLEHDQDLTNNQRNALIVTIEEKTVIHTVLEAASRVTELLLLEKSEVIKAVQAEINVLYSTLPSNPRQKES